MQCIRDERIFLGGSHTLSVSVKTNCFDLEEKVTGPFVRLLPVFAVWSLVRWWEALDLSQIAQAPSGLLVHCCELRRGRL